MSDKSWLDDWYARVGEDEAKRVSGRAARRGTEVHRLCENYLLNRPDDLRKEMPVNAHMFRQIKPVLDSNVNDIIGSELFLYSDTLKIAGACDLIAKYQGITSVIDFKTSGSNKTHDGIEGYWLQTALYAFLMWERTKVFCSQLVIIIAVENENRCQVFVDKTKKWIPQAAELVKRYHKSLL